MGHARCLAGVGEATRRDKLAEAVVKNDLSVRALEEVIRRERTRSEEESGVSPEKERPRLAHLRDIESQFEHALKTKVTVRDGKRKGSGRIVIEYYSLDDFDRIAAALGVALE
jgi:ParB family chromosome partitioning protein